jgi:NAD(P)-dependent dehydrogenase (short-subunit alcohol dehydrogenase family)
LWSHVPIQFELPEARWEGVMRIAVTGASGQIGSQVVRILAGEQAHQVVALSRRVLPSGQCPAGVTARAADYAHPGNARRALPRVPPTTPTWKLLAPHRTAPHCAVRTRWCLSLATVRWRRSWFTTAT